MNRAPNDHVHKGSPDRGPVQGPWPDRSRNFCLSRAQRVRDPRPRGKLRRLELLRKKLLEKHLNTLRVQSLRPLTSSKSPNTQAPVQHIRFRLQPRRTIGTSVASLRKGSSSCDAPCFFNPCRLFAGFLKPMRHGSGILRPWPEVAQA